jgi:hypothetical protein
MVWSKHDFEREVHRQMVELESIRKRCPGNADIHRRIDLLEESHRSVLRKLGDVFNGAVLHSADASKRRPAGNQDAGNQDAGNQDAGNQDAGNQDAGGRHGAELDPRVLQKFLRTSDQASGRLKKLLLKGFHGLHGLPPGGVETQRKPLRADPSWDLEEPEPCEGSKCITCGKTLFADQRRRAGIVFDGTGWHHRRCPSKGEVSGP